jgi:DnaJ-class molecular chaperone
MTTKYPRSIDEPECPWCDGTGEWEVEYPDRATDATGGQAFHVERCPCTKCGGTGVAKFDPADLLARMRNER